MSETTDRRCRDGTPGMTEYHARHRWEGPDSLHGDVIEAVAAITGQDVGSVAANYDLDQSRTIENLFGTEGERSYGLVRFELGEALVTVHSDGRLVAERTDERGRRSVVS